MSLISLRKLRLLNIAVISSSGFNLMFSGSALAFSRDGSADMLRAASSAMHNSGRPVQGAIILETLFGQPDGLKKARKYLAELAHREAVNPGERQLKDKGIALLNNRDGVFLNYGDFGNIRFSDTASGDALALWLGGDYTPQQLSQAQEKAKRYYDKALKEKRVFTADNLDKQVREYAESRLARGLSPLSSQHQKILADRLNQAFYFHRQAISLYAQSKALIDAAFILSEESEQPFYLFKDSLMLCAAAISSGIKRFYPLDMVESYARLMNAGPDMNAQAAYGKTMEMYLSPLTLPNVSDIGLIDRYAQEALSEYVKAETAKAEESRKHADRLTIAEVYSANISKFLTLGSINKDLLDAAYAGLRELKDSLLIEEYSVATDGRKMYIALTRKNENDIEDKARVANKILDICLRVLVAKAAEKFMLYRGREYLMDLGWKSPRRLKEALEIEMPQPRLRYLRPESWAADIFGDKAAPASFGVSATPDYSRKKTILDIDRNDLKGRIVYVRVDWNIKDFSDLTRVTETFELIKYLRQCGARIVLQSHRERYKDIKNAARQANIDFKSLNISDLHRTAALERFSLEPVVDKATELLRQRGILLGNEAIRFIPFCFGEEVSGILRGLRDGEVAALENPRFYEEEELAGEDEDTRRRKEDFSRKILEAIRPQVIVFDAPGTAHRGEQVSAGYMYRFVRAPDKVAGLITGEQMNVISTLTRSKNLGVMLSGAKLDEKIGALKGMIERGNVKAIWVSGGAALAFLAAQGKEIGRSLGLIYSGNEKAAQEAVENAREVLRLAAGLKIPVILPEMVTTTKEKPIAQKQEGYAVKIKHADFIAEDDYVPDIPEVEIGAMKDNPAFKQVDTIFLNGTAGADHILQFREGSDAQVDAFIEHKAADKVVGGGDGLTAFNRRILEKGIKIPDNIKTTTMGGSLFAFLEEGRLSALDTLDDKDDSGPQPLASGGLSRDSQFDPNVVRLMDQGGSFGQGESKFDESLKFLRPQPEASSSLAGGESNEAYGYETILSLQDKGVGHRFSRDVFETAKEPGEQITVVINSDALEKDPSLLLTLEGIKRQKVNLANTYKFVLVASNRPGLRNRKDMRRLFAGISSAFAGYGVKADEDMFTHIITQEDFDEIGEGNISDPGSLLQMLRYFGIMKVAAFIGAGQWISGLKGQDGYQGVLGAIVEPGQGQLALAGNALSGVLEKIAAERRGAEFSPEMGRKLGLLSELNGDIRVESREVNARLKEEITSYQEVVRNV